MKDPLITKLEIYSDTWLHHIIKDGLLIQLPVRYRFENLNYIIHTTPLTFSNNVVVLIQQQSHNDHLNQVTPPLLPDTRALAKSF